MTLLLHCGATTVEYEELRELETPPATATHVPIPHFRLVDMLRLTLGFYGHEVTEEHHGVTADGARYFGLLSLRSTYGGYEDTVVVRNSHDKRFPASVGFGGRTLCCDNLSFYADHVIRRRHTANLKRDLPGLVGELIEPLAEERDAQHKTFLRYQRTILPGQVADAAIVRMYRDGIINVTRIAEVVREWDEPSFEEFAEVRSAWRLFNAVTRSLEGRIVEKPEATRQLHSVMDDTLAQLAA